MEFIRKTDNEEVFWKHWNRLVAEQSAGPRYMQSAIENFIEMSTSRSLLIGDESIIVVQNTAPVGGVFLPIEESAGVRSISFSGHYTIAPLFADESVCKVLLARVDEVAVRFKVKKVMFVIDPLLFERYPYNFLSVRDYLDTSFLCYLIDLTLQGDLLRHCRRGHRCDIKTILKNPEFECFVVDKEHPDYALHEGYRELHRIDAGRVTRSKASFDSQFKKLKDGNAVLFGMRYAGKPIAYAYYEMLGDKAIYSSAASDPTMTHFPLYHALMWNAMQYLQKRNTRFIDVGQPANPSAQYGYYLDKKTENIARFKRGFGGRFTNEQRGIKYYDQELFIKEVTEFRDAYAASLLSKNHVSE
jgi:hypothetical protein